MKTSTYGAALTREVHEELRQHLLQHYTQGRDQEDLCFALWRPSSGATRLSALVYQVLLPKDGDRVLHRNASVLPKYLERAVSEAASSPGTGLAFLHSHPTPGWQSMSHTDIETERRLAPRVAGATGLPLVGLTMGTNGDLSARFWPRIGRGEYSRAWCSSVRVVGGEFAPTFMDELCPSPDRREELRRTQSAWGSEVQGRIARIHCGVVGLGSVGSVVAESLVRMGVQNLTLIDFDKVERHNLDRLLHATATDIGKRKVTVAATALRKHATAASPEILEVGRSITDREGLRTALDCDVLFSCVDRPWPRQVLNVAAYSHLIPVVDGGVRIHVKESGLLRSADWRAHVSMPGRPCLECLGQYTPAEVGLEREGLLDDPTYIEGLPADNTLRSNKNVFAFSSSAATQLVLQFLRMVVAPLGISDVGPQAFHFVAGTCDSSPEASCHPGCPFLDYVAAGDEFPYSIVDAAQERN